jgi:hypothetical protein
MHQCRRGNESVALGFWVGDMQLCASTRNSRIDGKNPIGKGGQDVAIHPRAQHCTLRRIASLDEQDSQLHLQHCDRGQEEARWRYGASRDVLVRLASLSIAQLSDDICISTYIRSDPQAEATRR